MALADWAKNGMTMKKLLLLVFLLCAAPGCPFASLSDLQVRDARITNNVAAMTLEATIVTAELLFELEQRMLVEAAVKEEGITKSVIRGRLKQLRAAWDPVWQIINETRAVQSKLAAALEAGDDVAAVLVAAEYVSQRTELSAAIAAVHKRIKEKTDG